LNGLTARAAGERLTLAVNGTMVAGSADAALQQGAVGLFVGGDLNEVAFKRFTVQSLE
jgi:hypothetical protein